MANGDRSDANEQMAELERDAFLSATYVSSVQVGLIIVSSLLTALGIGLIFVSILALFGIERAKELSLHLSLGITLLLWAPAAIIFLRLESKTRKRTLEREFSDFLDQNPDTASRPVKLTDRNLKLRGTSDEIRRIWSDPLLRQRIVAAFGMKRLRLSVPLGSTGIALAGMYLYSAVVAEAGLSSTLRLLILPAMAILVLGIVSLSDILKSKES